jgi:hypothetical protein
MGLVEMVVLGQVFPKHFSFLCQFSSQPHLSSSSTAGIVGPIVAGIPTGLSLTPPYELKKNLQQRNSNLVLRNYVCVFWNNCEKLRK